MSRRHARRRALFLLLVVAAVLMTAPASGAQSGGGYDLTWNSIDGGGYMSSVGGDYELAGTVGQPAAGLLAGGGYALVGGFWAFAGPNSPYLPLVVKN